MDGKPIAVQFGEDLKSLIRDYSGQGMTVAEALGVWDIVRMWMHFEAAKNSGEGERE